VNIFIDHNIWDQLFKRNVDLDAHFPKDKYSLYVTRQGSFEIRQTPDTKAKMKEYINTYIKGTVQEDSLFGFGNPNLPSNEQRVSGFGMGRFSSIEENEIRAKLARKYGSTKKRKSTQILYQQEADIELAARSINHPIITLDVKAGPLKDAKDLGGKVVFINLSEIDSFSGEQFVEYIQNRLAKIKI
jgi:hypothetical protein